MRIYTDTSAIGMCLDEKRHLREPSLALFDRFRSGQDVVVISDLTLAELERAPMPVRAVLRHVPAQHREYIEMTPEAESLASAYIAAGVIGAAHREDARHIATATVHHVDVLISWNVRHIVNLDRIRGYNSVNMRHGCPLLEIRSPREVTGYEE